jgi:hypothetical protein
VVVSWDELSLNGIIADNDDDNDNDRDDHLDNSSPLCSDSSV